MGSSTPKMKKWEFAGDISARFQVDLRFPKLASFPNEL